MSDTYESLTAEERTCSECGKPNVSEIQETGSLLMETYARGNGQEFLCGNCRTDSPQIIGRNNSTGWWLEKHRAKLVLRGPYSQRDEYPLSYEAALMHGMNPTQTLNGK